MKTWKVFSPPLNKYSVAQKQPFRLLTVSLAICQIEDEDWDCYLRSKILNSERCFFIGYIFSTD